MHKELHNDTITQYTFFIFNILISYLQVMLPKWRSYYPSSYLALSKTDMTILKVLIYCVIYIINLLLSYGKVATCNMIIGSTIIASILKLAMLQNISNPSDKNDHSGSNILSLVIYHWYYRYQCDIYQQIKYINVYL